MKHRPDKTFDVAVSEVIGEILMVALVVTLAAVVSAFVMGLIESTPEPTLTAFKVDSIYNNTTKKTDAIRLLCMAGDEVSGRSGGSAGVGQGNKLEDVSIHIVPPGGNSQTVSLCAAIGSEPFNITPGTQLFIVKRLNTYFLVTHPAQSNCNGGGGDTNREFTPGGTWNIIIADTLRSNSVIYSGEVHL